MSCNGIDQGSQANEPFQDIFNYLTSGVFPSSIEKLSPGAFSRSAAKRNFR